MPDAPDVELVATGKAVLLAALQGDYTGLRLLIAEVTPERLRGLVDMLAVTAADALLAPPVSAEKVGEFRDVIREQIAVDRARATELG
jgi:hypothetical protein